MGAEGRRTVKDGKRKRKETNGRERKGRVRKGVQVATMGEGLKERKEKRKAGREEQNKGKSKANKRKNDGSKEWLKE